MEFRLILKPEIGPCKLTNNKSIGRFFNNFLNICENFLNIFEKFFRFHYRYNTCDLKDESRQS